MKFIREMIARKAAGDNEDQDFGIEGLERLADLPPPGAETPRCGTPGRPSFQRPDRPPSGTATPRRRASRSPGHRVTGGRVPSILRC